jgi:hypothetical protein
METDRDEHKAGSLVAKQEPLAPLCNFEPA